VVKSDPSTNKTQGTTIGYLTGEYNIEFCEFHILVQIPKSSDLEKGRHEKQMTTCQPGNSIQEATHW
jgi:hypothetical protein